MDEITIGSPHTIELIDRYTWEKDSKIITQDVHRIPGIGNITHFSRMASQPATPRHYHSEMLELHCVVKGRRNSYLYLSDGTVESCTCTGNEAYIIFPGEVHSSGLNAQDPCETFALQVNTTVPRGLLGLEPHMAEEISRRLMNISGRHRRVTPALLRLIRTSFQLLTDGDREAAVAHLICFLFEFTTMPVVGDTARTPGDPRIRRSIDYIHENITEPLALTDLARISGCSLSRFKSRFREETGHTPGAFITAAKVEAAKRLLTDTNKSITEIAIDLGWSTANYFCSVFKKRTGVSPLKYRRDGTK